MRTASPSNNGRGSDAWFRSRTHLSVDRRSSGYCCDVRPPSDQHDHGDDRCGVLRARWPDRPGSGPQRRRLRQRQPGFLPGPLRRGERTRPRPRHWASVQPDCRRGSTSLCVWPVPRWSASLRSGDAPAAREASSYWPVTCDSPRARTRCSASSRSALVAPPGGPWRGSCLVGRGRALEILLVADDLDGPRSEQYGYVNRVIADNQLDDEVEAIASRLARFDHDAIARTKSYVDQVTLPANSELGPPLADFRELFGRPAAGESGLGYRSSGSTRTATSSGRSDGAHRVASGRVSSGREELESEAGSARASSRRDRIPSLANTLRRCHSTVRGQEPGADLRVRQLFASEPRDLRLLRGQLIAGLYCPRAHLLAGRQQLAPRAGRRPPCRSR